MQPLTIVSEPALILYVNDDEAERYATTRRLKQAGYRVLEAGSGQEALEQLERGPDLVLLDVRLPDLHGFEVCRRIREHHPSRWLPIVHVSAVEYSDQDVVAGLEGGADAYLVQPVPFAVLRATVRALLRAQREQTARALAEATTASLLVASRQAEVDHHTQLQMLQSQKMEAVGKLAGGVAHDFNNMLAVINGYASLLLEESSGEAVQQLRLREILRAGERAARLTRQLLAFSRRQVFAPEEIDPNELVRNLEGMLARLIGEDIELRVETDPGVGRIKADRSQLEQCLINLAVNAREAMPDGGRLTISISRTEAGASPQGAVAGRSYVTFTVRDNGCGMPPEVTARVFEPFFTTKGDQGTGMGLSIVYGIVTQSGGCVEAESSPGAGAELRLHFPRVPDEADPQATPASPQADPEPETVLLVEDEEMLRQLGRTILELEGYSVLTAANGAEAIEISRESAASIDLLITDVVMPGGMSGRDVADRLGNTRKGLRVLYMSGYLEDAVMRHGVEADGIEFLQKPFSPAVLVKKVRELLDT